MFARRLLPFSSCCKQLVLSNAARRGYLWRPWWWDRQVSGSAPSVFDLMDREMKRFEREFDRFYPWRALRSEVNKEDFHFGQPIVEENGVQKMKLVFDVSRFKPSEIAVKTSNGKLMVEAKHKAEDTNLRSKFEYFREYTLPDGVKADEVTCKYTDEGLLLVEAPYTAPPAKEAPKGQDIQVKHE